MKQWYRWIICLILCGNAICYPINRYLLVPIQDQLMDWYSINAMQYNLLMTLYAWPNTVCCILFGILIDKFGVRKILSFVWFLDIIGLLLIVYSGNMRNYTLLCVGRTIVGMGNEGLNLSLKLYAISFFKPHEYGIVFGIFCTFTRIGSTLNTYITYQIFSTFGIIYAIAFPLFFAPFFFIPLFILMFVEKYYFNDIDMKQELESMQLLTKQKEREQFKVSDISKLPVYFWILCAGFTLFAGVMGSFTNISVSFIHHMFAYNYEFATLVVVFSGFVGLFLNLIFGYLTTRIGRKMEFLLFSNICAIIGFYIYGWIHSHVFFAFFGAFLHAISYASLLVFWSAIPLVVIEQITGTAFGFSAAIRFLITGCCYIIVGLLTETNDGNQKYIEAVYFFLGAITVSSIIYIISMYLDVTQNHSVLRRKTHPETDKISPSDGKNLLMTRMSIVSACE